MNLLRMQPRIGVDALETIASGVDHAEGICLTPDGTLYVSGEAGQIDRVNGDGTVTEVATTGGWTLGLPADANGRIYACDPVRRAVLRWTPSTNEVKVVSTREPGRSRQYPQLGCLPTRRELLRLRL